MTLTGDFRVALPLAAAFRLFTARGERAWVEGWEPRFPLPIEDDAEVGTVFETDAGGQHITWIVIDRIGDRLIRYARVATGRDAGTVEVALAPSGSGSRVTVTYRLTPLTPEGGQWLAAFAADYANFLSSWESAIDTLTRRK
ncbi:hypothetical protein Ade02nite_56130 [Paractinoplanes deccanensis]|uniref:SRPBCC family protein n=1 Tax=Paractinoplanes deccanensis TaxID=113561 RepID=A0ABQ3YAE1_9ACTN|nr:SRPBCC family protein [Actinoplanes deccanensis]GID76972.1 hypothetical protein Ade02nite_56130 [Actinoplanes deccanensis]